MTLSKISRIVTALVATAALGLGMTACGGGTIGYMWVLGTFYNQITGFKIDNYTGNLTVINHSPFASGGTNPVSLVVKAGGRFLYVVNTGVLGVGTKGSPGYVAPVQGSIAEFSIGGEGILTFQQNYFSQGTFPIWATTDSTGNYLYVLDKFGPQYQPDKTQPNYNPDASGSITAFGIAADTGRLSLIPNTSITNGQIPTNYFRVSPDPVMTKVGSGSCLFTLSPKSIFPYSINGSNGQLVTVATGEYGIPTAVSLNSINTSNSSFTYLTDGGGNQIFSLQAGGSTCSLSPVSGSQQTNLPGTSNPVNSITSSSGKFLYVLNQTSTTNNQTNTNSSISAFTVDTTGKIAALGDGNNNPYAVGSGPVCIAQDPSNQYLYISNNTDSTVTGKLLDQNRGYLSNLQRGSVFPVTMKPTCLAVSGNI